MLHGFLKLGFSVPYLDIADPIGNGRIICDIVNKSYEQGVELLVFPELCLSLATCSDLFYNRTLTDRCISSLEDILSKTKLLDIICIVGLPYEYRGRLFNFSAVIFKGRVLGFIPRRSAGSDLMFSRWFDIWPYEDCYIDFAGQKVPVGDNMTFVCDSLRFFIGESDGGTPPDVNLVINPSSSLSIVGRNDYIRSSVYKGSVDKSCAYAFISSGACESTGFGLFSGAVAVCENGVMLLESFENSLEDKFLVCDIDIDGMNRVKNKKASSYDIADRVRSVEVTVEHFSNPNYCCLTRKISATPFVPEHNCEQRFKEIADIQSFSLASRMKHANVLCPVVGVSGGLDSALAVMVCVSAVGILGLPASQVVGVTMPGMGTTSHTKSAAKELMEAMKITSLEISIKDACVQHYNNVGISLDDRSTAFENVQARERTQILMSVANIRNGMVVGTCDMSEIALGWATYGGDQMSMFNVNNSIPKTLVRCMVKFFGEKLSVPESIINSILDMPVSPELLPAEGNHITQRTEEIIGKYDLHDFFIYYFIKYGFTKEKIVFLAKNAFKDIYDEEYIRTCLDTFFSRMVSQQFKRSASPDGIRVGTVSLGRYDLILPSDMSKSTFS